MKFVNNFRMQEKSNEPKKFQKNKTAKRHFMKITQITLWFNTCNTNYTQSIITLPQDKTPLMSQGTYNAQPHHTCKYWLETIRSNHIANERVRRLKEIPKCNSNTRRSIIRQNKLNGNKINAFRRRIVTCSVHRSCA